MIIDFLSFYKNPSLLLNDPSYIYRCQNMAHGLEELGYTSRLLHIKNYRPDHYNNVQVVVLHRPLYTIRLHAWVALLKRKGVMIIADIDDLVFHPDFTKYSPAVKHHILTAKQIEKRYSAHYKALSLCDHITTSTLPLYNQLSTYFSDKKITLIHNAVHYSWHTVLPDLTSARHEQTKFVTYFPGTKSHDKDFALIKKPLEAFLNDNPDIKLSITGQLDYEMKVASSQLQFTPRVKFSDYAAHVAKSWLNLCPLEQSPFNDCKSALKVIEAGHWGTPTIASPNPDVERLTTVEEPVLAYIASTDNDWYNQLSNWASNHTNTFHDQRLKEATTTLASYKKASLKIHHLIEKSL